MQSIETWLMVPTIASPEGLMRVAENDGKPVLYAPRSVPTATPALPPPPSSLVEKLLRRFASAL